MSDNQLICSQCGGELVANENIDIYMCKFCGVAFGRSLLFDVQIQNDGKQSFLRGEYGAADRFFQVALVQDPHSFDALVGRIKCAAKWKKLVEVYDEKPIMHMRINSIKTRIDDAVKHAHEEDRPFFLALQELFDAKTNAQMLNEEYRTNCNRRKAFEGRESLIDISENSLQEFQEKYQAEKDKYALTRMKLTSEAAKLKDIHGDVLR